MDKKAINLFQLNLGKIPGYEEMTADDFSAASADERRKTDAAQKSSAIQRILVRFTASPPR